MEWEKPFGRHVGDRYRSLSSTAHLSCWDCEHVKVAGQPSRRCGKHPLVHIYSPMPADQEAEEEIESGRAGTVADRCNDFAVASEFEGMIFTIFEERVSQGVGTIKQ